MKSEKKTPQEWAKILLRRFILLAGPILVYLFLLLIFWITYPPENGLVGTPSSEYLILIGLLIAYLIPPLGKESIIPLGLAFGFPMWVILSGVILMDIVSALFITLNFDLLLKIPILGKILGWLMNSATKIREKRPWIEQLSYLGIFILMFIPFQGTGATNLTILGKLLAMKPKIVFAVVTVSSILSSFIIAYGFAAILELWFVNPWYAVLAVIFVIIIIFILYYFWKKYTENLKEKAEQ